MGDAESCSSRAVDFVPSQSRKQRQTVDVYNEVLCRLKDSNDEATKLPGFEDELWTHFHRLPTRYAMDVNAERAQDVLMHKRLLQLAHDPSTRPAIDVRLVQVCSISDGYCDDSVHSYSPRRLKLQYSDHSTKQSLLPPPAFGSLPQRKLVRDGRDKDITMISSPLYSRLMHEITISTNDKPKLLSQETERLRTMLLKEIKEFEKSTQLKTNAIYPAVKQEQKGINLMCDHVNIPADRMDVWEIDPSLLKYEIKIASGSHGDLYKGTFYTQDVAIKVLRTEHLNDKLRKEFAQEVYIMRKVRHKNVVQFIGACTRPPSLCIVTEFMCGGSMFDFLHKQKQSLDLQSLLRVAIDVSKGMNYLHQNNIIHRDLKAANLLMDENKVVKVADFGVARVEDQSGVMTAETGTYRWMAPEVIEHKPYGRKVDVFSFSIVLWELLTGKLPYEHLSPLQAAISVVQQGLRPSIPKRTHPKLVELLERCWQQDPSLRPEFYEILELLQNLARMVAEETGNRQEDRSSRRSAKSIRR
ncbi:serine/threonine-protein kinase STY46 isoform X2 [Ricinus communis]|uniref:serine/threonine-protein kinase STY46 isoform X2 n=1 Tax=Ricinus communis TaxID=3988 RepID=UPI00201AE11A|nr:serine/threonine-protein kinase STY46 isoform X2 [Ricinus communis]